jgi:Holliday junction DNA helicase RuvA
MISSVEGLVAEKEENRIVIEVAGVGYEIYLPAPAFLAVKLGERLKIFTADIVREDSHELFGFLEPGARSLFKKLTSVSGVGPRTALQAMSLGATAEILKAIDEGDVGRLTSVPGVGTKTAQKIILELRGKLSLTEASMESDLIDALAGLGYSRTDALKAVRAIPTEVATDEERLKAALKILSRH